MGWLADRHRRLERLCRHDIWQPAAMADHSLRGRGYAGLRVLSIIYSGLFENHITTRAAALSYASLLGLGPLVALGMLVAALMLNQRDPTPMVNALNRVITFIAPPVAEFEHLDQSPRSPAPAVAPAAPARPAARAAAGAPLVRLIDRVAIRSRAGAASVIGGLTLLAIVIGLFMSVENAFNALWGVRRGRSWLRRFVFYWVALVFGLLLFFAALTALSAAAFINVFFQNLGYGAQLLSLWRWMLPVLSILFVVALLTVFYHYLPNTRVLWWAALVGAVIVTGLLYLNNYLAFLYFRHVVFQRSLFGPLGILPVLLFGLYVFWFFVLLGSQISYALQNVGIRSSQVAWHGLSETARESLSLLTLLVICRRYKAGRPACSVLQLGELLQVPAQVLNECLNRLGDLGLVVSLAPARGRSSLDYRYQPARPLDRITLAEFKQAFERCGDNPGGENLAAADPVLRLYHERLAARLQAALGGQTLDTLLDEFPGSAPAAPAAAP
ncbi:MAG TPA: YhjD/YihY/BrkB family envelope integrity protein [Opitutaceae bacterium]|nr:YhjD/YihY/BrkB family envelope integrity protein [Opitutaceae bacterium]